MALATGLALCFAPLAPTAALAAPDGSGVVIAEAYLKGGSRNAPFTHKFVELYNPTTASISLAGWSIQYRSAGSTGAPSGGNVAPLSGSIAAGGSYLVQMGSNGTNGEALPEPDLVTGVNPGGGQGTLVLASQPSGLDLPVGSVGTTTPGVVDVLGYGATNRFETAPAVAGGANATPNSYVRVDGVDTDDNAADFVLQDAVTPQNSGGESPTPPDTTPVGTFPIREVQGTGATSPYDGRYLTTSGVVTAAYPTGGYAGYVIQTPGTGGALDLSTHVASDALFVYSAETVSEVAVGDVVEVTGQVSEFDGLTQIRVTTSDDLVQVDGAGVEAPVPAEVAFPADDAQRESLESMLVAPQGAHTVTDVYATGQYGTVRLAVGDGPLVQPTEIARPGTDDYRAALADVAARGVTLDDGRSTNFFGAAGSDVPISYLTNAAPVTVGAPVTFTQPVILDYRNRAWSFQPTAPVSGATPAADLPVTFGDVRPQAPSEVGGDVALASFNVLNYFTTTGEQLAGCEYYTSRSGEPLTVRGGCDARGAATAASLERQQAKIVAAIDGLGADVVSLEEIENSARFTDPATGEPKDRDEALATLVGALNEAAGTDEWDYVRSPEAVPANEDVIRLAFIYKPAVVETVGGSTILLGAPAFSNARQPLAQAFRPAGADGDASTFVAVANHFKSKGSGSGVDADQGDGQGASNQSRRNQAAALAAFADERSAEAGTDLTFLLGDFNAYSQEDPIQDLRDAGYATLDSTQGDEHSYVFDGLVGSLDHVLASPAAVEVVTGVDIWNVNSVEAIALEYSRFDQNVSALYAPDAFRASDHDPVLVGLDLLADAEVPVDPTPGDPAPVEPAPPVVDPGEGGALPGAPGAPGAEPVPGATPGATAPTASGALAFTGADLAGWVTLALVLLATGGTVLVVRRRVAA
ncbi:hypothetical protein GCM10027282_18100 [Frigoribacterium salinisoli]